MKKPINTIFLVFIFFGLNRSYAQEAFDLSDCLVYTINNSPKIKSEKLTQKKEIASLEEQRSDYLPQIDAYVNYQNYFNDLPTYIFPEAQGSILAGESLTGPYPLQLGLPHNLNTGFEISQTIFDMKFFVNIHAVIPRAEL